MTERPGLADDAEIGTLLRELTADDRQLLAPPDEVWAGIAAELASDAAGTPRPGDEALAAPADEADLPADVVSLSRWRTLPRLLVAAAAAAAVVVAGIVAVNVSDDPELEVVASADLIYEEDNEAFDALGADATAHVKLVRDDGSLLLEIDESALPDPAGEPADLEIWVIDDGEVISLGLVDEDGLGSFEVPGGLDLTEDSLVDISIEPRDGDEAHSGRSLVRAPLDFA